MNFEQQMTHFADAALRAESALDDEGELAKPIGDWILFCSPERMLIVAEILSAVLTYDRTADVAGLLKKLDEGE